MQYEAVHMVDVGEVVGDLDDDLLEVVLDEVVSDDEVQVDDGNIKNSKSILFFVRKIKIHRQII